MTTRPLWTLAEIVRAVGGTLDASDGRPGAVDSGLPVTGVSIDSRSLAPGDLFVPLTDARDGHEFVSAAFGRGAAAALVRASYARNPGDGLLIRVDDPLTAMQRLGVAARSRISPKARVVAVTGSAGKTGTKEMLRAALRACAAAPERVHAPEKSFNNHWGVPLTLARMPAGVDYAVFEIGMNHSGEIAPLTRMVRPHVAVVTNVLPVHVGNFADGIEGVAAAKAEIFEGLEPAGAAVLLRDSDHFARLEAKARQHGARVVTFGRHPSSDATLLSVEAHPDASGDPVSHVVARIEDGGEGFHVEYELGMPGEHLAVNSLAVVLALREIGCLRPASLKPLINLRPPGGRGARVRIETTGGRPILLLDESYNANPASTRAALANLAAVPREEFARRVAVLGDMLELGAGTNDFHVGLADATAGCDVVFCCGPAMRHLFEALPEARRGAWAPSSTELLPLAVAAISPGDVVMVKGSLGSRMAPIVDAVKKRFAG